MTVGTKAAESQASRAPRTDVILFDGWCNLCNGFVQFVIAHDPRARFRFAPLSSPAAARLLAGRRHAPPDMSTVILLEGDAVFDRSDAILRILAALDGSWRLVYALRIVPRPLRDLLYRVLARYRRRWFGRTDRCWVPAPESADRFLS